MHIDLVPNRNSKPTPLLRESWREGEKVLKRTLANLSSWSDQQIQALRCLLKGQILVPVEAAFAVIATRAHGHVEAILGMLRKLALERLLSPKRCRERDLVVAMIVQRLLIPGSKLANVRQWKTTTLAEELSLEEVDVNEVYNALDWLLKRQPRIEAKLAERHLVEGGFVLYDVSSSTYEGHTCSLAQFGKNRDGKKGKKCIVYGVLTDAHGRPVAMDVYSGETGDPATVPDQVEKLRERFGLSQVVLVGDRGLLTHTQLKALRQHPELGWISCLRSPAIRGLVESGELQLSLFDEQNLAEISSPDYPDERLIACYNPLLAQDRGRTRKELLAASDEALQRIARDVARRTKKLYTKEQIGAKVGRALSRFKVAKHYQWSVEKGQLRWQRKEETIRAEEQLDGIYVIRTSEPKQRLSAEDAVRNYKNLSQVERAFRCLKGIDLRVRPIYLRNEDHVRAHLFLCMLAYYLEWHLRKAWVPLLFEDEELEEDRKTRDPVNPATPSASVQAKKSRRTTPEGLPVHSLQTLLEELGTRARNTYEIRDEALQGATFNKITEPTPLQAKAFELVGCSQ